MNPDPAPPSLERSLEVLEGRVRALEQTVAALQDTRQLEARVAERVSAQVPRVSVESVVQALATQPLPPAVQTLVGAASRPSTLKQVVHSSWLAFDMVQELVAVVRMLLDRRYHMAWITRVVVVAFAAAFVLSSYWFPLAGTGWLGNLFDKLIDLVLAAVLFLALFCETRRYREWRAQQGPAPAGPGAARVVS